MSKKNKEKNTERRKRARHNNITSERARNSQRVYSEGKGPKKAVSACLNTHSVLVVVGLLRPVYGESRSVPLQRIQQFQFYHTVLAL